jgi:hypothetical protein
MSVCYVEFIQVQFEVKMILCLVSHPNISFHDFAIFEVSFNKILNVQTSHKHIRRIRIYIFCVWLIYKTALTVFYSEE